MSLKNDKNRCLSKYKRAKVKSLLYMCAHAHFTYYLLILIICLLSSVFELTNKFPSSTANFQLGPDPNSDQIKSICYSKYK